MTTVEEQLHQLLASSGLDASVFLAAAGAALATPTPAVAPAQELTGPEIALLRSSGVDVDTVPATEVVARSRGHWVGFVLSCLTSKQAAERLGVSEGRIRQRLIARTLHGFKDGDDWRVPGWQLEANRPLPGLTALLAAVRPLVHPLGLENWVRTPDPDLEGLSPREWLLSGGALGPVLGLAAGL